MADGLFLIGTDRGVGKTIVGVALVALLRESGIDATMMTPLVTGGAIEQATELLAEIGVRDERHLVTPYVFETLASPYVASRIEERTIDVEKIMAAYGELRARGKFVVVEGGGIMLPIARHYYMIDLLKEFALPSIIIGRTGRGTLNHSILTARMMLVMGVTPLGFILNGFGQYGEGFAESMNPDTLAELAHPVPVLGTLEWRPEYQRDVKTFVRALAKQDRLVEVLQQVTKPQN